MIPKEFSILGQLIKVKYRRKLLPLCFGVWNPVNNTIALQQSTREHKLPKEVVEQTFIHELTHAILDTLSYHDLSSDEKFVDRFSQALYQIIKDNYELKK